MKVNDVIRNWTYRIGASSASSVIAVDGSLYSYNTLIGKIEGRVAYITERRYSQTTTKHTNRARFEASQAGYEVKPLSELTVGK